MPTESTSSNTIMTIADLTLDTLNANRGTSRGRAALRRSIEELGLGRSIVIDTNG